MNTESYCMPGRDAFEVRAESFSNGSDYWYEPFAGVGNDTGVRVNAYTALGNCHVWKALNVLAGDIGQLPIKLFRKNGGKSVEVEGVPEIDCLRVEPNPWMLPSVWKETAMWVAALRGNSLNWIYRPTPSQIRLVPLRQDRVSVEIDDELNGNFYYVYQTERGVKIPFDREDVLHIQGLSSNGIWGLDLVEVAKNVIGQGLVIEKHINTSFANNARPGGILKSPNKITPDQMNNIRDSWYKVHGGAQNTGRIAVLGEALEYQAIAMTMEHAQVEQLRLLDRQFVASLFNMPLFKLNSLENSSTRSNLEQQNQEYLQGSLMRWLNRFAEEFSRKILSTAQRKQGYYYRWVTEALLRGDTQSRFSAYGVAITNRIMNPNECREKEDMPPYEGGDEYGNPNIDPKAAPADAKAANDADNAGGRPPGGSLNVVESNVLNFDVADGDKVQAAGRLVSDRLRQVIKTEGNDAERGAASKNFIEWIEAYYATDGGWPQLVARKLAPFVDEIKLCIVGCEFDVAAWSLSHAAESKRLLLKLADQTTQGRLAESVRAECETWNARLQ